MKLEREIQRTRATTSDQELRTRLKLLSDSQGSSSSTWAHIHKAAAKPLKFLFKVLTWEETKTVTRPERRNTWEWSRHEEGAHTYTRQHARSSLTGEHVRIGYNLGYSPFYTLEHSTITEGQHAREQSRNVGHDRLQAAADYLPAPQRVHFFLQRVQRLMDTRIH